MISQYTQFFYNSLKYINERTAAAKRGIVLPSIIDELEEYVGKNYFAHFSDFNKVGIYPSSKESTGPVGFYVYPVDKDFIRKLESGRVEYASKRKYIIVVKTKPGSKILKIKNISSLSDKKYIELLNELFINKRLRKYLGGKWYEKTLNAYENDEDLFNEIIDNVEKEALCKDNVSYLWEITQKATSGHAKKWAALLIKLGIDGIVDYPGCGTIHTFEPKQGVFLHKGAVQVVKVFDNKYTPDVALKRKEREEVSKNKEMYLEYRKKGWPVPGDTVKFTKKFIENRDFLFPGDIVELTIYGAIRVEHELSDKYDIFLESNEVEDLVGEEAEVIGKNKILYIYDHPDSYDEPIRMDLEMDDEQVKILEPDGGIENMKKVEAKVKVYSLASVFGSKDEYTIEFKNPSEAGSIIKMDLKYKDNAVKVVKQGKFLDRIK